MFVTMSATKSATNMTKSATNATKSATDATKLATDNATKDGSKADNITVKTKRKFGGNGGKTENITAKTKEKFGGNGDKTENITATIKDEVGGNGGNGGINTDESVGYEADIIRYVRLHPNATQRSIHTAIGVPLRTIQRTMSQLQKKGLLIRKGSRRLGQWKVID